MSNGSFNAVNNKWKEQFKCIVEDEGDVAAPLDILASALHFNSSLWTNEQRLFINKQGTSAKKSKWHMIWWLIPHSSAFANILGFK